jgi:hypothetical protein
MNVSDLASFNFREISWEMVFPGLYVSWFVCSLVCPPSGNMARKQCLIVCLPSGSMWPENNACFLCNIWFKLLQLITGK